MEENQKMHNPNELKVQWRERIKRYAIGLPIFVGICILLILADIFPFRPADLIGWAILILAGIPLLLCLAWIGESVFSKKLSQKISDEKLSFKRVIFALFVFLAMAGALVLLWLVFGSPIRQHFA